MGLEAGRKGAADQLGRAQDERRDPRRAGHEQLRAQAYEVLDTVVPTRRSQDHRRLPLAGRRAHQARGDTDGPDSRDGRPARRPQLGRQPVYQLCQRFS